MTTTRVFQNGNSQALRIPQEMRTEKKEYCISRIGDIFIAFPADDPWAPVRQVIGSFPEDFMEEREQPSWEEVAEREEF
ncbi:MAG: type II toxin-antitoxin system VapB family antitoxin [Lachnospiraceae bacterium]|nr:type II toxin-antitoxin system VapB family antitoxin [Lachnospiraceae bacterium]